MGALFTASGIATATAVAGVGLQALGIYQSGQAAAAQAEGQARMAEFNAKVQEREAQAREQHAIFKQKQQFRESEQLRSRQQAAMSASGIDPGAGTPLKIAEIQAEQSELDNLLIGYEGQVGAQRARSQAAIDRLQAGIHKTRASNASSAAMLGAGTSLLTGFGRIAANRFGF